MPRLRLGRTRSEPVDSRGLLRRGAGTGDLHGAEVVPAGPYVLECDFAGVLNDKLRGFYRSTFRDEDGVEHVIATTQFEVDRRQAGLSLLGRAAIEGGLLRHARRRAGDLLRGLERRRALREPTRRRQAPRVVRRHHPDVDLHRRLRRRPARGRPSPSTSTASRSGSSTSRARPGLTAFALEAGAHALRFFTELLRPSRIPATSSTSSRSPTSPPARWRTSAA